MEIKGIIAEFNPLHNGHKYILDKMNDKNSVTVAVISGNYVQRGFPATFSKFLRTEAALKAGADIVAELPSPWSGSPAYNFAYGGISILKNMGADKIYFGCECDNLSMLKLIAKASNNIAPKDTTVTFAQERSMLISKELGKNVDDVLNKPNNNLAIEYIKAAEEQNYNAEFIAISRIFNEHDSNKPVNNFASASLIRKYIESNHEFSKYVPENIINLYIEAINNGLFLDKAKFKNDVISYLRRKENFDNLPDVSEGLDNKLKKSIKTACSYTELADQIKSKRYTLARVRRLILSAYLDIDCSFIKKEVPYINILGLTSKGTSYYKQIAKTSEIPFIISGKSNKSLDKDAKILFNKECIRNDIYMSLLKNPQLCATDYTNGIIKEGENHD